MKFGVNMSEMLWLGFRSVSKIQYLKIIILLYRLNEYAKRGYILNIMILFSTDRVVVSLSI